MFKNVISTAVMFAVLCSVAALSVETVQGGELPSIFNGKDLTGWKAPENNIWYTVADGVLKVKSGPERKGSTLWTEKEYKNFIMQFDFKMGEGTVDSGIYVRNSKEQIQIGISGSLKRDMTGSPYISGKGYPVEANQNLLTKPEEKGVADLLKLDDWNSMTIVAKGKAYSVWLNGIHVMDYHSESAIEKGPVGIQLHGNRDMAIDYRNITLSEIR